MCCKACCYSLTCVRENSSNVPYICIRILLLDFYHAISQCCVSSCLIPCQLFCIPWYVLCIVQAMLTSFWLVIMQQIMSWADITDPWHYTKLPYMHAWPSSSLGGLRSLGLCPTWQPSLTETLWVRTVPLGALICFLTKHVVCIKPVGESIWQNVPNQSMEIWIFCNHSTVYRVYCKMGGLWEHTETKYRVSE